MKISLSNEAPTEVAADWLVIPVSGSKPLSEPALQKLDRAVGGAISAQATEDAFEPKRGNTLHVSMSGRSGARAKHILLIGLGDGEASESGTRLFGTKAARAALSSTSVAVVAPSTDPTLLRALTDGVGTGAYQFTRYFTGSRVPKKQLGKATILLERKPSAEQKHSVTEGTIIASAVNFARDLVNCPANDLTATKLAEYAKAKASAAKIDCKIWDKKGIEKLGMPLLLAVNRGSYEEPRLIHLIYKPKPASAQTPRVVFVGKGLTFDAGGLCLKPAGSMVDMKCDMAGAAMTIATVIAAAQLKLPVEVHAVVGSTDNMLGGNAYRPGDVFPSRDGKTVEIINTDAEGRLVLADALAYARELSPQYLIDHATLTGACIVALGSYRAGLFANDDQLLEAYRQAGESTGEQFWPMPLDEDLRDELKSSIADLKHTGSRNGGAVTAALFLREFVGDSKWAHLDIAGPSFLDKPQGMWPKGGTGFGVLTALQFLRALPKGRASSP